MNKSTSSGSAAPATRRALGLLEGRGEAEAPLPWRGRVLFPQTSPSTNPLPQPPSPTRREGTASRKALGGPPGCPAALGPGGRGVHTAPDTTHWDRQKEQGLRKPGSPIPSWAIQVASVSSSAEWGTSWPGTEQCGARGHVKRQRPGGRPARRPDWLLRRGTVSEAQNTDFLTSAKCSCLWVLRRPGALLSPSPRGNCRGPEKGGRSQGSAASSSVPCPGQLWGHSMATFHSP